VKSGCVDYVPAAGTLAYTPLTPRTKLREIPHARSYWQTVGAGMAGLTAARVLAEFFVRVVVLETGALPKETEHRPGTPQSTLLLESSRSSAI
jgi:hypothetical protein